MRRRSARSPRSVTSTDTRASAPGATAREPRDGVTGRGATVRRVLGGVLLAAAVALVVVGLSAPGAAPAARPTADLGTPLLSVRRTPQAVTDPPGAQTPATALASRTAGLQS